MAWRAFWAQLPYQPKLASIQKMINRRFRSNIRRALRQLVPAEQVENIYPGLYALIDGFWIRQFVDPEGFEMHDSRRICHKYLEMMIAERR
jgi:TetR/AcrR family transcriptional repressor of bet genes